MPPTARPAKTIIIIFIILMLFCTGCGTIIARGTMLHPPGLYPATKFDIGLSRDTYEHVTYTHDYVYILTIPVLLIDFPISIIFDTLLLPIDLST